jgi:hypothetical protein
VQRDALRYHAGNSLYEYARSAPPRFIDPTGLYPKECDIDPNSLCCEVIERGIASILGQYPRHAGGRGDASIRTRRQQFHSCLDKWSDAYNRKCVGSGRGGGEPPGTPSAPLSDRILLGGLGFAGVAVVSDGPAPAGDVVAAGVVAVTVTVWAGVNIYEVIVEALRPPKAVPLPVPVPRPIPIPIPPRTLEDYCSKMYRDCLESTRHTELKCDNCKSWCDWTGFWPVECD